MIDRTYLPYPSAREYVDRGMAKWMGFHFSEKTAKGKHPPAPPGSKPRGGNSEK